MTERIKIRIILRQYFGDLTLKKKRNQKKEMVMGKDLKSCMIIMKKKFV